MLIYRTIVLLALTFAVGQTALAQKKPIERIPAAVMRAELPAVNGGTVRLADYDGQVTMLIMWQPWCGPCNLAAAELNKFEREFSARGVRVVGLVTRDGETTPEDVARATDEYHIAYRSAWITIATARQITNNGVLPQILIVKDDGLIVDRFDGWMPQELPQELRAAVELALSVKPEK